MADPNMHQVDPSDTPISTTSTRENTTLSPKPLVLPLVPSTPGFISPTEGPGQSLSTTTIISPRDPNPFTKCTIGPGQSSSGNVSSSKSPKPYTRVGTGSSQNVISPRSTKPTRGGSGSGQLVNGKHTFYKGIRCRNGKWVSEIREPRKTTRVWLGTYPTPEMAAAAYDVAAMMLKGREAELNFRDLVGRYPVPESASPAHIRAAAVKAAALLAVPAATAGENVVSANTLQTTGQEYIDEEDFFNLPNLLNDMAEGMMISPPRMKSLSSDDDSEGNSDGERLWSYV